MVTKRSTGGGMHRPVLRTEASTHSTSHGTCRGNYHMEAPQHCARSDFRCEHWTAASGMDDGSEIDDFRRDAVLGEQIRCLRQAMDLAAAPGRIFSVTSF